MACAALAVLDTVVGCQTHRKDGAEDFAEHGITITFVAACQFFCAAQRHNTAAGFLVDVGKNFCSVCARMAVGIQTPAVRNWLLGFSVHLELTAGDDTCRCIEEERIWFSRHGNSNWVCAQHGFLAECRNNDGF